MSSVDIVSLVIGFFVCQNCNSFLSLITEWCESLHSYSALKNYFADAPRHHYMSFYIFLYDWSLLFVQ